ncbi:MAG TPA: hypothetical protein VLZ07_12875, partial [Syntrophales bacterium]|nr:hypothetical protein [Syntrophales bacterium]
VVVEAFLSNELRFMDMARIIEKVLASHKTTSSPGLPEIFEADLWARNIARKTIDRLKDRSC